MAPRKKPQPAGPPDEDHTVQITKDGVTHWVTPEVAKALDHKGWIVTDLVLPETPDETPAPDPSPDAGNDPADPGQED